MISTSKTHNIPMHLPEKLKKGDLIGIIAPAAQLKSKAPFVQGIQILKEMGFEPVHPRDLWQGDYFLADTDQQRANEFNRMWADPSIKALIAARGGYGSLRLLPFLDTKLISSKSKTMLGFSDITILNAYLFDNHQQISLHGPVVTSLPAMNRSSLERLYACLTGNFASTIELSCLEILKEGHNDCFAPLVGGNLSSLLTLTGTAYNFDYSEKILFLEDVDEPHYKLDRMLTQMKLAGNLDHLSGLILGEFNHASYCDTVEKLRYKEYIWNRVLELTEEFSYPIIAGFPVGHGSDNYTVPYGLPARINLQKKRLEFLQHA